MKYVEPEMEVVEWDATVITNNVTIASNDNENDVFDINGGAM